MFFHLHLCHEISIIFWHHLPVIRLVHFLVSLITTKMTSQSSCFLTGANSFVASSHNGRSFIIRAHHSLRFIAVGHKQHLPIDNIFCSTTPNFSFHTFCGNCRIFAIRQVVINTLVLVRFVQKCWRRHSYTLYTVVPSAIIPCEEVIDRIISCIALTLDIEVIDINISKHVSAPNDACDKQWPN